MIFTHAKEVLLDATFNSDGTFTRLRLGENPGHDKIVELRIALRVIFRSLVSSDSIPREIAFPCGVILHLGEECLRNLRSSPEVSKETILARERAINDLVQGAYEILAGASAEVVVRPDLGESFNTT